MTHPLWSTAHPLQNATQDVLLISGHEVLSFPERMHSQMFQKILYSLNNISIIYNMIDHRCHLQPSVLNPEMAVAPAQSRWASVDQWKSRVLPRGLFLPSSPTTEARPSGKGRGCGWSWELQPSLKAWGSHSGDLPAMYPGAESDTFSRFKIYPEHQRSTSRRPDLWKQVHLAFQSQAGCEEGLSWV